jgi:hypothetical protein
MKKYQFTYDCWKAAIVRAEQLYIGKDEIVKNERYVEADLAEEMLAALKEAHASVAFRNMYSAGFSDPKMEEMLQAIIAKAEEA